MKKVIKIILIVVASIVMLCTILGIVDYNRIKNGKTPIFAYRNVNIHSKDQLVATAYYGIGYEVIACKKYCDDNPVVFMPLYLGAYAWFIDSDITNVEVVNTNECDNKAKLYYTEENRKIYTYCLDQIEINKWNETMQLKDYLGTDSNAMEYIIDNFTKEPDSSYDDGGTKLYKGNDFNILECHTIAGNNDIYIGNKNMEYSNDFCK